MFSLIDKLKVELDSFRPLPKETQKSLRDATVLEWTYNSNAIEGNTLTLKETKVVLEGITIGGKSIREHLEAINHREAIEFIEQNVVSRSEISESFIKSLHSIVLKNIDGENSGKYRTANVVISGALHKPPEFLLVPEQMSALCSEYNHLGTTTHAMERAARLHVDFVKVHPFIDGNGRTVRLLMNFELMKSGWLPVIISAKERLVYYDSLDTAHTQNNYKPFIKMVANLQAEALNRVLSLLRYS